MDTSNKHLVLTAYHEAGHAVARVVGARARGFQPKCFEAIEIYEVPQASDCKDVAGEISGLVEGIGPITFETKRHHHEWLRWDIIDSIAGPASEGLFTLIEKLDLEQGEEAADAIFALRMNLTEWLESSTYAGGCDSYQAIKQLAELQRLNCDVPSRESLIEEAIDMVANNWGAVSSLAEAVLKYRRLEYEAALPIILSGLGHGLAERSTYPAPIFTKTRE
jgi:hypothetical protein